MSRKRFRFGNSSKSSFIDRESDTDVIEPVSPSNVPKYSNSVKPQQSPVRASCKEDEVLEVEDEPNLKPKILPREFDIAFDYNVDYEVENSSENPWRTYGFYSSMGTGKIKDYLKKEMLSKLNGFTNRRLSRIELILEEAIANAVEHGNRNLPEKKVRVSFKDEGKSIFLKVSDEGEGFNLSQYRYDPNNLEDLANTRGKGLYLMTKLADK